MKRAVRLVLLGLVLLPLCGGPEPCAAAEGVGGGAGAGAGGQAFRVVHTAPGLDLGEEPRLETPDYYLEIGPGAAAPEPGELLDVYRREPVPGGVVHNRFAVLRVARVYPGYVMARLESLENVAEGAVLHPRGVMVGDLARRRAPGRRPGDGVEAGEALPGGDVPSLAEAPMSELPWPPVSPNSWPSAAPGSSASGGPSPTPGTTPSPSPSADLPATRRAGNPGGDGVEYLLLTAEPLSFPSGVLFELDKAELRPEARQLLDVAAATFAGQSGGRVRVEGHTCDLGSDGYNAGLAKRRADAVYVYLAGKGVPPARMTVEAYGEARPRTANESEAERKPNRRVELHFEPAARDVSADATPVP